MSKLYGYLTNERNSQSTKAAHRSIEAIAQTQDHRITVTLWSDGRFSVDLKQGSPGSGYWGSREVLSGELASAYESAESAS